MAEAEGEALPEQRPARHSPDAGTAAWPAPLPAPNRASAQEEISERAETVRTRGPGVAPAIPRASRQRLRGGFGRVAIVDGCRTPFARAGTTLSSLDAIDLAGIAAAELVARTAVDPESIDLSIFGTVVPALYAPNLGREVVFRAALPATIPGSTVNLACASSSRALINGAQAILSGEAQVVLAGGAESLSSVPLLYSRNAAQRLTELNRAESMGARLATLGKLRLRDLAPVTPTIAEYLTGQTMGESCEQMARENDISRFAQDEIALLSHRRAAAAVEEGRLDAQLVPVWLPDGQPVVVEDNGIRPTTSMEALAALPPAFDLRFGTLTAGNSSPLMDGAAVLLLMSEEGARALGYRPLGYLRSYAFTALHPAGQLFQAAAYAAPLALERAGLGLADIDLLEMHEAFGAQIVSNLKALASQRFAREELGRSSPVGEVDLERCNVNGGTLAFGHPFGATGARVALQLLCELRRRGEQLGLATVCAAGGVGFAMVVERE